MNTEIRDNRKGFSKISVIPRKSVYHTPHYLLPARLLLILAILVIFFTACTSQVPAPATSISPGLTQTTPPPEARAITETTLPPTPRRPPPPRATRCPPPRQKKKRTLTPNISSPSKWITPATT